MEDRIVRKREIASKIYRLPAVLRSVGEEQNILDHAIWRSNDQDRAFCILDHTLGDTPSNMPKVARKPFAPIRISSSC